MQNQSQEIKLEIEGKYGYKITKSKCDKKKKKAFKSHGFLMEKKTHQDEAQNVDKFLMLHLSLYKT